MNKKQIFGHTTKCPRCGKEFLLTKFWYYKLKVPNTVYFCGWTCYRKVQAELNENKRFYNHVVWK